MFVFVSSDQLLFFKSLKFVFFPWVFKIVIGLRCLRFCNLSAGWYVLGLRPYCLWKGNKMVCLNVSLDFPGTCFAFPRWFLVPEPPAPKLCQTYVPKMPLVLRELLKMPETPSRKNLSLKQASRKAKDLQKKSEKSELKPFEAPSLLQFSFTPHLWHLWKPPGPAPCSCLWLKGAQRPKYSGKEYENQKKNIAQLIAPSSLRPTKNNTHRFSVRKPLHAAAPADGPANRPPAPPRRLEDANVWKNQPQKVGDSQKKIRNSEGKKYGIDNFDGCSHCYLVSEIFCLFICPCIVFTFCFSAGLLPNAEKGLVSLSLCFSKCTDESCWLQQSLATRAVWGGLIRNLPIDLSDFCVKDQGF